MSRQEVEFECVTDRRERLGLVNGSRRGCKYMCRPQLLRSQTVSPLVNVFGSLSSTEVWLSILTHDPQQSLATYFPTVQAVAEGALVLFSWLLLFSENFSTVSLCEDSWSTSCDWTQLVVETVRRYQSFSTRIWVLSQMRWLAAPFMTFLSPLIACERGFCSVDGEFTCSKKKITITNVTNVSQLSVSFTQILQLKWRDFDSLLCEITAVVCLCVRLCSHNFLFCHPIF